MTNTDGALASHPRLCLGQGHPAGGSPLPTWSRSAAEVARRAEAYLADSSYDELHATHNAHLGRARRMQGRMLTLVAQWQRTRDARFRDAAVACLDAIDQWEYWSWITWRMNDPRTDAIFDLSYGENSATLAFAYDLLYHDLSPAERERVADIAQRRALGPLIRIFGREAPWWFGKPDTNWNPVCAGGAGLLALAFRDELPEAKRVLELTEESLDPFFRALGETNGGCPEGLGYWNYGMRYAFLYLISSERATGGKHRLLRTDTVRASLSFPLDFCPHGTACSFGDGNHWVPLPAHRAAAEHLGAWEVARVLDDLSADIDLTVDYQNWATAAETVLWAPQPVPADAKPDHGNPPHAEPLVTVYEGLGWARVADRWPSPDFYLSIRGGTTEVPHGHLDLLSFHAVVGDERLIENVTPAEYLDTTFGPRRYELFEMLPQSKNVPLVNGVGIARPARVDPVPVHWASAAGVRLDATSAFGGGRDDEPLLAYGGRLFLMLGSAGALVVDRLELANEGRVESRLHTRARVERTATGARLVGERHRLTVALAASHPFGLTVAATVPTTPGDDATVLRWCGPQELGVDYWSAALLVPGDADTAVELEPGAGGARVSVRIGGQRTRVLLGPGLEVADVSPVPAEEG
ncbi:heparinase II/III family protein [Jiangella asiatica]|uniref:DUF4962 domain-containing protein n=1 Tax=Jiangella asiatica TaxID=2530372 RepID=A0A4R5CYP7_9ACTN|nr:heparinase II/III family protein [Jiangella asiatica]TDE03095.1 hypothetical protein E1269_20775 [Jiangella asiatica]